MLAGGHRLKPIICTASVITRYLLAVLISGANKQTITVYVLAIGAKLARAICRTLIHRPITGNASCICPKDSRHIHSPYPQLRFHVGFLYCHYHSMQSRAIQDD